MTGERPAGGAGGEGGRGGGRGGGGAAAGPADNTPPEFRSGFGAEGVKALEAFVQKGGTLVTFAQAGRSPDSALRSAASQRRRRSRAT